jgi:class 3 adenylate cyclase
MPPPLPGGFPNPVGVFGVGGGSSDPTFGSPINGAPGRGIRCAVSIVSAVKPLGLEVRAGLHTGEVEVMGDNIGGIAVHLAARISAEAHASEVVTSSTTKDLVVGSGITFEARGNKQLKGIPGEWALFAATA